MLEHVHGHTREGMFQRFFPPPTFLTMPAVGIDVSDKSIKYLELEYSKGGYKLVSFDDVPLAEGAVVAGEVKDDKKLADCLKEVARHVKPTFARASLPEQKAYFFTTEVSVEATHEQIIKMLEFELEEHVPLSPQHAVIDYDRLRTRHSKDNVVNVGVTVYPRETVETYTQVFYAANFVPLSFEIEAHAILRSVIPHGDFGTFMVVDLGETRTGIAIVTRGMLSFTSTLDNAGSDLTALFMKELKLSKNEVAHAKNTIGLQGTKEYARLSEQLLEIVDKLGGEMKRHRNYWVTHGQEEEEQNDPIEEIILCGGNANLKGLPGYLERLLGTPVRRANVWENVFSLNEEIPPIPYETSLSYSTAIGLSLRKDN